MGPDIYRTGKSKGAILPWYLLGVLTQMLSFEDVQTALGGQSQWRAGHSGQETHQIYHCCSVAQLCPTLCDPMDCSVPGFPVLHHLPELAQSRVHWVSDAFQPSHPLSPPSPSVCSLSQHQIYGFPINFRSKTSVPGVFLCPASVENRRVWFLLTSPWRCGDVLEGWDGWRTQAIMDWSMRTVR